MRRILILLSLAAVSCSRLCPSDLNAPMGWATCVDIGGGEYALTGGAGGRKVTLRADGDRDMREDITEALETCDIVVLDGSRGPFIFSHTADFHDLKGKTLVGINGAVLRTKFQFDEESRDVVEHAEERYASAQPDSSGVWILSNGASAKRNYAAFAQRQALIDYTGDRDETFTHSGFFAFLDGCENIIIRNIFFDGPGTFRSLADFMVRCAEGSSHIWIDHCTFEDAARVSVGVTHASDCISLTWCRFTFTDQSDDHTLGNLIASSDTEWESSDNLNVTFAHCAWQNVWSRVPMARFGTIHILNCWYDCPGTVGINPRQDSEFLVEGCWFEPGVKPLCRYRHEVWPGKAWVFRDNVYDEGADVSDKGDSIAIPYPYTVTTAAQAREDVREFAGPTLKRPLRIKGVSRP